MTTDKKPEIWIAKAIGITLVAYGHFGSMLDKPAWYALSKEWVYLFHMPLFLMLSGYLFHRTLQRYTSREVVLRAFKRLIIPYLIFAYLITLLQVLQLRGSDEGVTWQMFVSPLYEAQTGSSNYLWFLPALFILQIFAVMFKPAVANTGLLIAGLFYLFRIGVFSNSYLFFPLDTQVFFLSYVSYYGLYFFIGLKLAEFASTRLSALQLAFIGVFFALSSWASLALDLAEPLVGMLKLLAGVSGSFLVWQCCKYFTPSGFAFRPLVEVGKNSDVIYLFHIFPIYFMSLVSLRIGLFGMCLISGIILAIGMSELICAYLLPKSLFLRIVFGRNNK
ncbi:acyltransferase family protein [Porphyromonas pogonae]|uniref:acyltransferase family protein n=1 Tax=Porphyromonas pogonae TaxID=867595 RepID=UPI002E790D44|nr:acyltransferase family protein [Porphyromonas pogonae]